ncbi:MAG TPA: hypothetical protein VNG29_04575 [Candidatus Paceibacterota bacterium]|nr:hypothetical protein [Candidatus Paceibacterota bacterium]
MDQSFPSFEHEALERDIKALSQEISKNRERPESKELGGEALLREAIRAFPATNSDPAAKAPVASASSPLPAYAQAASAGVKLEIEYLLDVALHQGISKAMSEAQKSPYFVQDAFHDALAGKLYPELQKRGIVK